MRAKRGIEHPVAVERFIGCCTSKLLSERSLALHQIGAPHLEDRIGKPKLENASGDRRKHALITQLRAPPSLLLSRLECPQRFGLLGAVAHASIRANCFEYPGVGFSGSEAFHFER